MVNFFASPAISKGQAFSLIESLTGNVQLSTVDIILGSSSPRRAELLTQMGVNFEVVTADIDETPYAQEQGQDYVQRMAVSKAKTVAKATSLDIPVLAADTIVLTAAGSILGKPENFDDFCDAMRMISGVEHFVMTSIALSVNNKVEVLTVTTVVEFCELSEQDMAMYWASGEPQDKAGGYGIQGLGGVFVKRIVGSYSNVVGLPIFETRQLLAKAGIVATWLQSNDIGAS